MSEESRKYTLEQQMVIERAMEGDLRFFFNDEKEIKHYEFIAFADGNGWGISEIEINGRSWHYIDSPLDDLFWDSCEDALNAKIFDGKSLLEILDKVTIP